MSSAWECEQTSHARATIISAHFVLLSNLRLIPNGQVVIHMCLSLLGLYVFFLLSSLWGQFYDDISADVKGPVCVMFSAIVHYFFLVYFFITVAQSLLLYLKIVKVIGINSYLNRYQLKFGAISWSESLIQSIINNPFNRLILYSSSIIYCLSLCWFNT